MKLAALIEGEPGPLELWTLKALSTLGELQVVQAHEAPRERGLSALLTTRLEAREDRLLDALCDGDGLHAWWRGRESLPARVRALDGQAERVVAAIAPDALVALGGAWPSRTWPAKHAVRFSAARWTVRRAIVDGRPERIAVAIERLEDDGVLWRGAPQLAPGDGAPELLFRARVEGTRALLAVLKLFAAGRVPAAAAPAGARDGPLTLREWARYLLLDRGRRARFILERGITC